jgi:hypothetical protein
MKGKAGFSQLLIATSFVFLLLGSSACTEEPDNFVTDFGYNYSPISLGQERIYQIDSFIFDEVVGDVTAIDTSTTWIRDRVQEVFPGANGDSTFRVERSISLDSMITWDFVTNYTIVFTRLNFQVNIENVRTIDLVFPVRTGQVWDPTVYISDDFTAPIAGEEIEIFKNWSGRIRETGFQESIGSFIFPDVARIELADEENAIELRQVTDWYARDIGLVRREMQILNTQQVGADTLSWIEKAEEGFILQQTLVEYR